MRTIGWLTLFYATTAVAQAPGFDPDINDDGIVNILDVSLASSCYGWSPAADPICPCSVADLDLDGDVDLDDLGIVSSSFGVTGFPPRDTTRPRITAQVTPEASASGWHNASAEVSFECLDCGSGIAACTAPILVATEGEGQQISGTAIDVDGNTATATLVVNVDFTAPSIQLLGPSSAGPNEEVRIVADVSPDTETLRFTVDGVDAPELSGPPFEHRFVIPGSAPAGASIAVTATATDRASNTTDSLPHFVSVVGGPTAGGFAFGEAYDAELGLPLAAVTVSHAGGRVVTDPWGRFGSFIEESVAVLELGRDGFTTVERVVSLHPEQGTRVLDARLTPLEMEVVSIGPDGGTASSAVTGVRLDVPPGALSAGVDFRLTEISAQGLRAPLPLGWSPVGAIQLDPPGSSFAVPAELSVPGTFGGLELVLARYDEALFGWVAAATGLTGNGSVAAGIESTGMYAFVVADRGATAPPAAELAKSLPGALPVDVDAFSLSATSQVEPPAAPIGPDARGMGSVVLFSDVPLPSGTIVSARVEESFESFEEGELRPAPFTQELAVYRFPPRGDDALHASFPVTPSRSFTPAEIAGGRVHVDILEKPSFLRGRLVGSSGRVVSGANGVELDIPAGALDETTAAFVELIDPAKLDLEPVGLSLLGAIEVDLSGRALALPATLRVPAPGGTASDALFAVRVLAVQGLRKLALVGRVSLQDDRLIVENVVRGGTYLVLQSAEPLALVSGVVTESALPARLAIVESSSAPFADVTDEDGAFLVAAGLRETTLTARSLVSGNAGRTDVLPLGEDPLTANIELAKKAPFVTAVTPLDGATAVGTTPQLRVDFSEPVRPESVTASSFILRASGGEPVSGTRVVVGVANRSASLLVAGELARDTAYTIELTSAVTDVSGNELVPFASSFHTSDATAATFDPDAVEVSFPDGNGEVTVSAGPGSFEPFSSVVIVNLTRGIVVSGETEAGGGFSFSLFAALSDELQIRVVDASGREAVLSKTEFVAEDGRVAIGARGGRIEVAGFTLDVPEGALVEGVAVFDMIPLSQEEIDALPVPEGDPGANKGLAVAIDTGGVRLAREAKLSFPVPSAAPEDAQHIVVRAVADVEGTLYEVIDTAIRLGDRVTTSSFPFQGANVPGTYVNFWHAPLVTASGPKSPLGAITGVAREVTKSASSTEPEVRLPPGVRVQMLQDGEPRKGGYFATTQSNGRFTLLDPSFGVTQVVADLRATDQNGRTDQQRVFENPGVFAEFPALNPFNRAGDVVFNFDAVEVESPGDLLLLLFRKEVEEEVSIQNGFTTVGEELIIRAIFTKPASLATLSINGDSIDLAKLDELSFVATFVPRVARSYTVEVEAFDAFLTPLSARKNFVAIEPGAENDQPLVGPPSIIDDASTPKPGAENVPPSARFRVEFTEPVTNVSSATVVLRKKGAGETLPLSLVAFDLSSGETGEITADSVIASLAIFPEKGLEFDTAYELVLSADIVDTDEPTPLPLATHPSPTIIDFRTFAPESLGSSSLAGNLVSMTTLGATAFVARQGPHSSGSFGNFAAFDLSDPTRPRKLSSDDVFYVGSMSRRVAAEEAVPLGGEAIDIAGVYSFNPRSGNSGVTFFDVTERRSSPAGGGIRFPYAGVVTTLTPGGGFAADLDIHEGFAYAASGTGGLQIIDLGKARELFRANSPDVFSLGLEMSRRLFTKGEGFGQEAIVSTFRPGPGTRQAVAIAVGETSAGTRGYVGSVPQLSAGGPPRLSALDLSIPFAPSEVGSIELKLPDDPETGVPGLSMGWPNRIGLTSIGNRHLVVVVGGLAGASDRGVMAVVDVSRTTPELLSLVELDGGYGRGLAFDDDGATVFVSTPREVVGYSLVEPANPELTGRIAANASDLEVDNGLLLTGETLSESEMSLESTALRPIAFITGTIPFGVVTAEGPRAAEDFAVAYQVFPSDFPVASAELQMVIGSEVLESLEAPFEPGTGAGALELPFGHIFTTRDDEVALPRLVVNGGTPDEVVSAVHTWNLAPFELTFLAEGEDFEFGEISADEQEIRVVAQNEELYRRFEESADAEVRVIEWDAPLGVGTANKKSLSTEGIFETALDTGTEPDALRVALALERGLTLGRTLQLEVIAGQAVSPQITADNEVFPGDGATEVVLTLEARDQFGNPVEDGSLVFWDTNGDGEFTAIDEETSGGKATAVYRAGFRPQTPLFTAEIHDVVAELMLAQQEVKVEVQPAVDRVSIWDTDPIDVDITVTSEAGDVSDDAPLEVTSSVGVIELVESLSGGRAKARWRPAGGMYRHFVNVGANIEFWRDAGQMAWVPQQLSASVFPETRVASLGLTSLPPAQDDTPFAFVELSPSVIAGNASEDGTFPLELADGTTEELPYRATSEYRLRGLMPGEEIRVQLGSADRPNIFPVAMYTSEQGLFDGDVVPDDTGLHDGIANAGVLVVADSFHGGQAYELDGAGRITVPHDEEFDFQGDFMVRVAVKPLSTVPSTLVSKADDFRLELIDEGAGLRAKFTVRTAAGEESVLSATPIDVSEWSLVCARVEGARLVLAVDDVERVQVLTNLPVHSTSDIEIGVGLRGALDDLMFFDLTQPFLSTFPNGEQSISFTADASGEFSTTIRSTGQMGAQRVARLTRNPRLARELDPVALVASAGVRDIGSPLFLTPAGLAMLQGGERLSQEQLGGYFTTTVTLFQTRAEMSESTLGYVGNGLLAYSFRFIAGIWGAGEEGDMIAMAGDLIGSTVLGVITVPRDLINAGDRAIRMQASGTDALDIAFAMFEIGSVIVAKRASAVARIRDGAKLVDRGGDAARPLSKRAAQETIDVLDEVPVCPLAIVASATTRSISLQPRCNPRVLRTIGEIVEELPTATKSTYQRVLNTAGRKRNGVRDLNQILKRSDNPAAVIRALDRLGNTRQARHVVEVLALCPQCRNISGKAVDALAHAASKGVRVKNMKQLMRNHSTESIRLLEKAGDFVSDGAKLADNNIHVVMRELGSGRKSIAKSIGAKRVLEWAHKQRKTGREILFEQDTVISRLKTVTGRSRRRQYDVVIREGDLVKRVEIKRWQGFPGFHAAEEAKDQFFRDIVQELLERGNLREIAWQLPSELPIDVRNKINRLFLKVLRSPELRRRLVRSVRPDIVTTLIDDAVRAVTSGDLIRFTETFLH